MQLLQFTKCHFYDRTEHDTPQNWDILLMWGMSCTQAHPRGACLYSSQLENPPLSRDRLLTAGAMAKK